MTAKSKPLRFGYMVDFRNPPAWPRPWAEIYAESLDFLAWTETAGFEIAWLPEHHCVEDGFLTSPMMIGAALAARTKKLRITSGVALAPLYHPLRLAEDMAVLDLLSNGRSELAVGLGYLKWETDAFGVDFKSRGRRTDELLQIVKRLWAGETVTFEGEFFNLRGARISPLPVQKPHIPLLIGGLSPPGFRRCARYGDGFIGAIENYPAYLQELRAAGKDEKTARFDLVSDMWVVVSEDPEATFEEVAPHFYYQINTYAKWHAETDWGVEPMDFEAFKKSGVVKVFTPGEAIEFLRSRRDAAPAMESYCMTVPPGFPLPKFAKYAELFAKKVIPAFR
jgi:alkanesulfonate monooxygenase SsuD/methylene tetrahydromethanopterin reductase-like flavin-dependent oxidoreductase (luciferase family)